MDFGLGPNEGAGGFIIGLDEGVDMGLEFFDVGE